MTKAKVLVVEDDTHLLSGIRDILELEDYEVITAENGQAALEVLHLTGEEPPDIIVSDIMMPLMDGFAFLQAVRKEDAWITIPFIFLTAKGEKSDQRYGTLLGADVYLTKPFDPEDLVVAVDGRLKRHRGINRVQTGLVSDIKRKILTILNHEVRTPLTLVVAYADMLKEFEAGNMSDIELMMFLKGVSSGAERLQRLLENFILLVELDSGDAEKTFAWRKGVIESLQEIIETAQNQILGPESTRQCPIYIEGELPAIIADRQYLTVAVRELLANAVKFSDDDSPIEMGARRRGNDVEIWVRDYGRGVPESEFENIWDTFYQIDRDHHEDQGAGAGLSIVRGVILIHGGSYRLESVPGQGSTFYITLPTTRPDDE